MVNKFTALIEKTDTGFSAYIIEVHGLITVGDTVGEIKNNIHDVLDSYFEYLKEEPDYTVSYTMSIRDFFKYFKVFNKTELARYCGFNKDMIRHYTSHSHPSKKRLAKLTESLDKFKNEIQDITLIKSIYYREKE